MHIEMDIAWHGRLMVAAWVFAIPLGIFIARFFKILPRQDWPSEIDSQIWWRSHLVLQIGGCLLSAVALIVVLARSEVRAGGLAQWHAWLGWSVLALACVQVLGGLLRGTKGGPREPGDHYDMTRRRLAFEVLHKSAGYLAVVLANVNVAIGLRMATAPEWMWIGLFAWWGIVLGASLTLQRRGRCVDTYQAIYGPGEHPGKRQAGTSAFSHRGIRRSSHQPPA